MPLWNRAWTTFDPIDQTWIEFKEHSGEAYEISVALGAGTIGANNYYGSANADDTDGGLVRTLVPYARNQ